MKFHIVLMYGLKDIYGLAKMASKHFKVKFKIDLICIILLFCKKIWPRICIMKNIFWGQQNSIKLKNNIIIKTKKNLVNKEGPPDIQSLLFSHLLLLQFQLLLIYLFRCQRYKNYTFFIHLKGIFIYYSIMHNSRIILSWFTKQ